jgi:hypothetical protein
VSVLLFAYGSNMLTGRIRARVATARPIVTGYVDRRRLVFHKRGKDGSAKADAASGGGGDRVWGVVYSLGRNEKLALDQHERGYATETVIVQSPSGNISAELYVAEPEMVDTSLKPFDWYRDLVVHGACEHSLPANYRRRLAAVETIADQNRDRRSHNRRILRLSAGR